ncbi:unnamed protein product [Lampetra fluviatilis]
MAMVARRPLRSTSRARLVVASLRLARAPHRSPRDASCAGDASPCGFLASAAPSVLGRGPAFGAAWLGKAPSGLSAGRRASMAPWIS